MIGSGRATALLPQRSGGVPDSPSRRPAAIHWPEIRKAAPDRGGHVSGLYYGPVVTRRLPVSRWSWTRARRPMSTCDRVTKLFGSAVALWRVDLEVTAGEFVLVHGPNGSGKSTLLRILAGLTPPTAGHVRWDAFEETAPRIVRVGHSSGLYDALTPMEHFDLFARLGWTNADRALEIFAGLGCQPRRGPAVRRSVGRNASARRARSGVRVTCRCGPARRATRITRRASRGWRGRPDQGNGRPRRAGHRRCSIGSAAPRDRTAHRRTQ